MTDSLLIAPMEFSGESATANAPQAAPQPPHLLIVDDEENIISSLRRLLRRENYRVSCANSGRQALEILEKQPADLVITDYRMPGQTGLELLREIRKRWPDTIRILLTGYTEVNAIISAINEGEIYKFFTKPWNDEELKLNIHRAVEQAVLKGENERMKTEILRQNVRLRELNELLHQKASDASNGLSQVHRILDYVPTALFVIDPEGLIVWASRGAARILPANVACPVGIPARDAFEPHVYEALFSEAATGAGCGLLSLDNRSFQWRRSDVGESGESEATIVVIWETVAP